MKFAVPPFDTGGDKLMHVMLVATIATTPTTLMLMILNGFDLYRSLHFK